MQLRHLRTFLAVAETLNFTRAAERINLSQSSATEQIQALEDDLGVRLFDRSRRRLSLTPTGQRLVDHATELLRLADETRVAVAGASDSNAGSLVIGALETLCASRLPKVIAAFRRRYPAVELSLTTADSGHLRSGIGNGDVDIGFVFGDAPAAKGLRSEVVGEEDLLVALPRGHHLTERRALGPDDLADESFLVTPKGCVYRKMFDDAFAEITPRSQKTAGEFASFSSICGLVEAGMGCALVPRAALSAHGGQAVGVPWIGKARTTPVTMIWRHRSLAPPAMAAFLATARDCMGGQTRR